MYDPTMNKKVVHILILDPTKIASQQIHLKISMQIGSGWKSVFADIPEKRCESSMARLGTRLFSIKSR